MATGLLMSARGTAVAAAERNSAAGFEPTICLAWAPGTSTDCPDVEDIAAAVRDTLGHRRVTPERSPASCETQVNGVFRPDGAGGWSVDLHFASRSGESLGDRFLEIREAPCAALEEPLALVIALMAESRSSENMALRLPNPSSRPLDAASRHMTTISIGGAISSGLTADVGLGAALGVASRAFAGLPLRLETTFWFPTTQAARGPAGEFWAWLGAVGICPSLFRWKQLAVSACARVAAGVIRGVGQGLDENAAAVRPLAAGGLGAHAAVRVSRQAALYLGVGAAVPWLRARFVYRDPGDAAVSLHQPGVVIPAAELGIEFGSAAGRAKGGEP